MAPWGVCRRLAAAVNRGFWADNAPMESANGTLKIERVLPESG